jgi:hypothetical protein
MEEEVKPDAEPIEELEWEDAESTTRSDLISCAYYAINAVDEIDLTLISKIEANKIKKIRRQSLDIIAEVINELHAEMFDVEEDI